MEILQYIIHNAYLALVLQLLAIEWKTYTQILTNMSVVK